MQVSTVFIWFILYSMMGWVYETAYCSLKSLKWDNRGILMGPYCPIYGVGAVLDVLLCGGLGNGWAVFFACMAGSAALEYATSYGMERMFHAVWWDYSNLPLNLHGRICLPCSLGFGAAGLLVLYGIHPYMERLTAWMPRNLQELAALLFMAVFVADCTLTADSLMQINVKLEATVRAIDGQISERYDAWVENSRHSLSEGLAALKEKVSLEEFRERRTKEEVGKTVSTLSWIQARVLKSSISFRLPAHKEIGGRIKKALSFRKGEGSSQEGSLSMDGSLEGDGYQEEGLWEEGGFSKGRSSKGRRRS